MLKLLWNFYWLKTTQSGNSPNIFGPLDIKLHLRSEESKDVYTEFWKKHLKSYFELRGIPLYAGNNVKFLFTHSKDKRHERRVKAAQLIEKGVEPDTQKYLMLLYSSAANLLSFEGYTTQSVYETVTGQDQRNLLGSWRKGDELWLGFSFAW